MEPLTGAGLVHLFRRMRQYRLFFWAYVLSCFFYAASVVAFASRVTPSPYALGDVALAAGLAAVGVILGSRWAMLRPSAFLARAGADLHRAVDHAFFSLLLLLALGESLGMGALTAASLGAAPAWKPLFLCLWQLLLCAVLTPDRAHWDRLLTVWETATQKEVTHDGSE